MRKVISYILLFVLILNCTSCSFYTESNGDYDEGESLLNYPAESPDPRESVEFDGEDNASEQVVIVSDESVPSVQTNKHGEDYEMRGVWISYLDYENLLTNKSQQDAVESVTKAFADAKELGLNTLFLHVRPFADAFYISDYFPWSHILKGEQAVAPGYDPLAMMIDVAHSMDMEVHAWLNPYRVKLTDRPTVLSDNNIAKQWLESGGDDVIETSEGVFFNPASPQAVELVVNGAEEIVRKYDIDGIHFDDYFYPTTDPLFDKSSYDAYISEGGELELAQWRMENVNTLIKKIYSAIKAIKPDVLFGISPAGGIRNNYEMQYADVKTWCSNSGYIDYIMPQIYFGYDHGIYPYTETVLEWANLITVPDIDLYVGLAPYKIGLYDEWAGDGIKEWVESDDVIMRQIVDARTLNHYGGFVLYRYDSLFNPEAGVAERVGVQKEKLLSVM